ncbi:MAG: hypothetical protein HYY76_13660 [Acidobacteria bacterium]|nr:hypothetical protein [Acidobacteriota bacterium]
MPRLPDSTVDLGDGVWVGGGPIADLARVGNSPSPAMSGEPPLLPWARQLRDSRNPTDDPHLWCLPMGVPRTTPYPFRFVANYTHKAPTHLFILHEGNIHSYRQIFMDGRGHPEQLDPTWYGHSVGRWEGDTLVIDTVGFNDKFWFDRRGTPHSERLHTVERWTRVDYGRLINEVTIDDPGAFSRPFTVRYGATLQLGDDLLEYICQENNQFGVAGGYANPFADPAPGTTPRDGK